MFNTKTKRYLVLLAAIGLVAAALGGTVTFASFTAQTTNANNTFATGTLLLSNTVGGHSACHSESNASNTATCPAVISASGLGTSHAETSTVVSAGSLDQTGNLCSALMLSIEEDSAVGGPAVSCLVGTTGLLNTCN